MSTSDYYDPPPIPEPGPPSPEPTPEPDPPSPPPPPIPEHCSPPPPIPEPDPPSPPPPPIPEPYSPPPPPIPEPDPPSPEPTPEPYSPPPPPIPEPYSPPPPPIPEPDPPSPEPTPEPDPPSPPPPIPEPYSPPPPPSLTGSTQGGLPPVALAGLIAGTVVIVLIGMCVFFIFCWRRKRKGKGGEAGWLPGGSPKPKGWFLYSVGSSSGESRNVFTYEELAVATEGFSGANLLGQGGFGYVHKGVLTNGKVVAVKQLKVGSRQGEREFRADIEIISRIHHRHLVSLVGYCITEDQRMLVYEFVPNNTMEFYLHGKERPTLNWATRMKIAIGSAKGLAYLHEDCQPKVIHGDIKSSNILLTDSFEAKLTDFVLAKRSLDTYTRVSSRIMGTFGYMAPEYASSGKLTDKSDVFSFGVVLLELITGCRPVDTNRAFLDGSIVDWARPLLKEALEDGNYDAVVDPKLNKDYDISQMNRMITCAAACVRHLARLRPRISQILRALEGNLSLDDLNEEGIAPGQGNGGSDYSPKQYKEDVEFRKMALESDDTVNTQTNSVSQEYSGTSSVFGQQPSRSSTEDGITRPQSLP